MSRVGVILVGLAAVALVVLFYFLAWQPKSEEIAEVESQIESVELQQQQLQARIVQLEQVRAEAPEVEAAIVAAESIVPRDLALPSALRQLQLAADNAGATLVAVSATRPAQVEDATPGLAAVTLTLSVEGGYFQLVDFLRRVEDPVITPRGVLWLNMAVSESEYPTLSATLTGRMYALLPVPPAPPPPPPATPTEGGELEGAPAETAETQP